MAIRLRASALTDSCVSSCFEGRSDLRSAARDEAAAHGHSNGVIAAEVGPLRAELSNAAEPNERKRIQREIRRWEKRIRREVLGARAHW